MRARARLLGLLLLGLAACGEGGPPGEVEGEPSQRARPAVHAGTWYPAEPETLRREIEVRLEAQEPGPEATPIIAAVGPHAGLSYSGSVGAAAYAALRRQKVGRVFLLGPSHHLAFEGVALPGPELRGYATPLAELRIDQEAVEALRGQPGFAGPAAAHEPEHSLEMHAIFLAAVHPEARIVPLVVGRLGDAPEVRALAARLRPLLRPGDLVIASSDFTHYGPNYGYLPHFEEEVPQGLEDLMRGALAPLLAKDLAAFDAHLGSTGDTICGREVLRLLLGLLPGDASAREVASDTSGRITGSFRNSVSYVALLYRRAGGWPREGGAAEGLRLPPGPEVLDAAERELALRMARQTLRAFLESGRIPDDGELGVLASGPLRESHAAFVTLKKGGILRGCMGSLLPVQPLWRDIRDNAIAAAVRDPRFPPVSAEELGDLQLEISVLTAPSAIPGPEDFEVGLQGVILRAWGRRAVFLPQVAREQGWGRATTLTHLARKAGLPPDAWRSPEAKLSVFEAQVFGEVEEERAGAREPSPPAQGAPGSRV